VIAIANVLVVMGLSSGANSNIAPRDLARRVVYGDEASWQGEPLSGQLKSSN